MSRLWDLSYLGTSRGDVCDNALVSIGLWRYVIHLVCQWIFHSELGSVSMKGYHINEGLIRLGAVDDNTIRFLSVDKSTTRASDITIRPLCVAGALIQGYG